MNILVINCGSSSLKFQLIDMTTEAVQAKGLCERIGIDGSRIVYNGGNGATHGVGKWVFEQGASGTFQTADGKTVTVSGGLITGIS